MSNRGKRGDRPAKKSGYNPPKDAIINAILDSPIIIMGEETHELHFREPELGDLDDINIMKIAEVLYGQELRLLIHRLGNIPLPATKKIKLRDMVALAESVGEMTGPFVDSLKASVAGSTATEVDEEEEEEEP